MRTTAVWRPAIMVAVHATGALSKFIAAAFFNQQSMPSVMLKLQLVDLLLPSLLASYNLPSTINHHAWSAPLNFLCGLAIWLPKHGVCAETCRRASDPQSTNVHVRLLSRCG